MGRRLHCHKSSWAGHNLPNLLMVDVETAMTLAVLKKSSWHGKQIRPSERNTFTGTNGEFVAGPQGTTDVVSFFFCSQPVAITAQESKKLFGGRWKSATISFPLLIRVRIPSRRMHNNLR
ncbi:MAG TPA: hypothetical protein VFU48_15745 [Nitrospira sp.]|nr:hypothetical protein [Nitrospira sp.]